MIRDKLIPVLWLFCCAIIIGASIGLAARAGATPNEDRAYIETLDAFAVPYPDKGTAIGIGQGVCAALDAGASVLQVVSNVVVHWDYSPSEAGYLTGAAIGAWCDEYAVLVDGGVSRV